MNLLLFPFRLCLALADGVQLGLQVIGWGEPAWPDSLLASADGAAGDPGPAAEESPASAFEAVGAGHLKPTAGQLISAAIGLREYADSDACEAPVYWRNIADQLDPQK
jgi:hypothetical protein